MSEYSAPALVPTLDAGRFVFHPFALFPRNENAYCPNAPEQFSVLNCQLVWLCWAEIECQRSELRNSIKPNKTTSKAAAARRVFRGFFYARKKRSQGALM